IAGLRHWPAELFVWRQPDRGGLVAAVKHCRDALAAGASPELADLAASAWQSSKNGTGQPTLAVVASSLADLKEKLDAALQLLGERGAPLPSPLRGEGSFSAPRGFSFAEKPAACKVAFLFPGQGSQSPDMLAQVAMTFPEVRESLDAAERALAGELD